jgi:hypothetical protein
MEIFEAFKITNKISSITFDNAFNNNIIIPLFKNGLNPPHDFSLFHQRCICHIINLIVQVGVQKMKVYIENIRNVLSYITCNGRRQQEFNHICDSFGLPHKSFTLDVPHRWNSLYIMLKECLPYKEPLKMYYNGKSEDLYISDNEFNVAYYFIEFLKPFYNATEHLSGVYYATSPYAIHHLHSIAKTFHNYSSDPYFLPILEKMKAKFLKYWNDVPLLYTLTACLNPRTKIKVVTKIVNVIKNLLQIEESNVTIVIIEENLNYMFD